MLDKYKYRLLSKEFLMKYSDFPEHMTEIGKFVYLRTYSRWIGEKGRRETWKETCIRAVEYNCALAETPREEAEKLFDNMFNLKQALSGRTLWTGATEVAEKYPISNFNCFRRDTEFLTRGGIKSFNDFENGDKVEVLNGNGAWSEATIRNYGTQKMKKLVVKRCGTKYTEDIYVTGNHKWFVQKGNEKRYKEVITDNLKTGDVLRRKVRYENCSLNMCNVGIQHGIVFGDGTFDKKKGHCRVSLIGKKQDYVKYFNNAPTTTEGDRDSTLVYGLPYYFKDLPPISANVEYIKGFIYGLLLTDGGIGSSVRLGQKDLEVVKQLQSMCEIIGLTTSKLVEVKRTNNNLGDYANIYEFTIHKEALNKQDMLSTQAENRAWIVKEVLETDLEEEVWCVEEPITNSFSLRGGIHTHNCSFTIMNGIESIRDLFYLLMVGTGVGFRILESDVVEFPKVKQDIKLTHKEYDPVPKMYRDELSTLEFFARNPKVTIRVGDSKEGWVQAITHYFEVITNPLIRVNEIEIVYDSVRPKGERLKTFGGTASGHESLQNMFEKIHNVITTDLYAPKPVNGKLRPIHLLDICNIIGENVVVGGVRRTSEIALLDANDKESIEAKSNLTPEKYHRFMSNNSIFYNEKPSREQLAWQFQVLRETGEPCFVNAEAGRKRNPNFQGVNPCFTGDMKLLTKSGYVRFDELVDTKPIIINKDGVESEGKVWCSGEKEVYEVKFINRSSITCTGNHVFMTIDGEEVEARNLKGKRIMPFISKPVDLDELYIKLGFIQGDGCLSRLESKTHLGLEVNIGKDDGDVKKLFGFEGEGKLFYTKEFTNNLVELGFSSECLPDRALPTSINSWNINQKKSFLNGLYSANGSVISSGRIALKSTCKELLNKVQELLSEININSYITTNKSKKVSFSNGDYVCKESYDLNIQQYDSRLKFYQEIGFVQEYKMIKLEQMLINQSPKVISSNSTGKIEKVYDFTEPITHWGVVEGLIAHNCVEILLDDKQTCNLTTVNVLAFVEDGKLNLEELLEAQRLSARAGLRMTCLELELPAWNEVQKRDRLLGCSITGFKDAIELLDFSIEEETELQKKMGDVVRKASREYAEEIGISIPLLSTALKPEGTLSQVFGGVSSGLHHAHSPYYIRRVRINAHDPLCKTLEASGWDLKNEVGQGVEVNGVMTPVMTKIVDFPMFSPVKRTKYEVPAMEQLETYYNFQSNYTDHNSSNTITVKDEEWEGVEQNIWDNWDDMVAVSFLKLDGHVYDLAPYEAITKEQYEEMLTKVKPIQMHLLEQFETGEEEEDLGTNDDCSSGSCPIR